MKRTVACNQERNVGQGLPGFEQLQNTLLGAESADEQRIVAASVALSRIVRQEVGFAVHLCRRPSRPYEGVAAEATGRYVGVDQSFPCAQHAMTEQHQGNSSGLQVGMAITTAHDPAKRATIATCAALAILEKRARGAKQPIVVERLQDGDTHRLAGIVSGRADQGQEIVAMGDIRPFLADQSADVRVRSAGPTGGEQQKRFAQRTVAVNFSILAGIHHHTMTRATQHIDFSPHHTVFAAALLILVMYYQYAKFLHVFHPIGSAIQHGCCCRSFGGSGTLDRGFHSRLSAAAVWREQCRRPDRFRLWQASCRTSVAPSLFPAPAGPCSGC